MAYIWNEATSDYPRPTTVNGMSGWFTLPRQWATQPYPGGSYQIMASPNNNFNVSPVYICTLDDSGQNYAFQDLLVSKYWQTSGNPYWTGVSWSVET